MPQTVTHVTHVTHARRRFVVTYIEPQIDLTYDVYQEAYLTADEAVVAAERNGAERIADPATFAALLRPLLAAADPSLPGG
jgi:hypothetical protein